MPPLTIGLFLGHLTAETRSLWPALAVHVLVNLSYTAGDALHLAKFADSSLQPLWMWLVGAGLSGLGAFLLAKRLRLVRMAAVSAT